MVPEVCMLSNDNVFQMETQFNFSEESCAYIKKATGFLWDFSLRLQFIVLLEI